MSLDFEDVARNAKLKAQYNNSEPISFAELEHKMKEWFLIKDHGIIKVLVGTIIANRLPGDPVWVFLVAPSGGLKSELIQGLNLVPEVYPLSKFTPQTLISGHGKDQSLLLRLTRDGKTVLAMKDFTTILQMDYKARNDILAQLREVYDGSFKKAFGMKGDGNSEIEWNGKLGFLAGVTPVVDITQGIYASMGERFLQYRIMQPPRRDTAKKALQNSTKIRQIREDLKDALAGFIKSVTIPESLPEISEEDKELIIEVANFATLARSSVMRESYHTRAIEYKPESEMPTRFINQINLLAYSFMIINDGPLSDLDRIILQKISLDSIPQFRRNIVELLVSRKEAMTSSKIAVALGYPTNTVRRVLEDLNMLGVLERISGKDYENQYLNTGEPTLSEEDDNRIDKKADFWSLKEEYVGLLNKYSQIIGQN